MSPARLFAALLFVGGTVCDSAAGTDQPAAPSTRPAGATTRPANARIPSVSPEKIRQLVAQLASDRYALRRIAHVELRRIVDLPDAGPLLRKHLKDATDAETKAALVEIVGSYGLPLVTVWPTVRVTATADSYAREKLTPAAPCLFVKGDGSFVYGAATFMFSASHAPGSSDKWRQGRLGPVQLYRLKEAIRRGTGKASGQAPGTRASGVEVALHVRSGSRWNADNRLWTPAALGLARKGKAESQSGKQLPEILREMIAAAPSRPYEGPWCLYGEYIRGLRRQEVEQVPDWPIKNLPVQFALAPGGMQLDGEQLGQVRALLKEAKTAKQRTYKFARFAACRVSLAPYLKEARESYFGPGR